MRNHFAKVIGLTTGGLLALAIPALAQGAAFTITTCVVGARPDGVAVADVNGDGRPDLISANNLADTLTVLTNNGAGGFGSNATLAVGSGPYAVVATDINGDGKPDLISANYNAGTLTVLTNNGSGGFGSNTTLTVDGFPDALVVDDINGDGKKDLISANLSVYPNPGTLTVLTNNGAGGFGSNTVATVGLQPFSLAAADLNGDGRMDLISANHGDNTLTVLMQTDGPLPVLSIAWASSNTVKISWPLPATGFVLQTNASLSGTNWGNASYFITTNGATGGINVTSPANRLFFRLKK
ncbi:MAG: VCBS repeat-containing protein [Verrucomicrobiota bacterium]